MKVFVTSDLHFGHAKILEHQANRDFQTVEGMDLHMLGEWNEAVGKNDKVYVVGDFSFRMDIVEMAETMAALNGEIHLVRGNHDHDFWKALEILKANKHLKRHNKDPKDFVVHRDRIVDLKHGGHRYVMCHYPMETWDGAARSIRGYKTQGRKVFHLHGHQHGNGTIIKDRFDVGYDNTSNVVTLLDDIPAIIEAQNQMLISNELGALQQYEEPEIGG